MVEEDKLKKETKRQILWRERHRQKESGSERERLYDSYSKHKPQPLKIMSQVALCGLQLDL